MTLLGTAWTVQIVVMFVFAVGVVRGKAPEVVDDDVDQAVLPPQWRGRSIREITHLGLIDPDKLRRSPAIRIVNALTTVVVPFMILLVLPWILGTALERALARRK